MVLHGNKSCFWILVWLVQLLSLGWTRVAAGDYHVITPIATSKTERERAALKSCWERPKMIKIKIGPDNLLCAPAAGEIESETSISHQSNHWLITTVISNGISVGDYLGRRSFPFSCTWTHLCLIQERVMSSISIPPSWCTCQLPKLPNCAQWESSAA